MKNIRHQFLFFVLNITFFISPSVMADLLQKSTAPVAEPPDLTMSLLKVTGGLLLVIIAILGSAWAYRRFVNLSPAANDSLKIIGGVSLGAKDRVILMQVGEEQILLGISPGRIQRLHVLDKNIEFEVKPKNQPVAFSTQLNSALKQCKAR